MERNEKMKDYPQALFEEGSPVIVDKMQLCYSHNRETNILRLTIRNASLLPLYGLSIIVETYDKEGNHTTDGDVEYHYYGLQVPSGRTFGEDEGIIVDEKAVSFDIRVIQAEYPQDNLFQGDIRLRPIQAPQPLESLGDLEKPFLARVKEKKPNLKVLCVPEEKDFYWRCTCKSIYPKDFTKCRTCRVERDWIVDILPKLREERCKAEEAEAERKEAIRLAEEESKRKVEEEEKVRQKAEEARQEAERLEKEEPLRKRKKKVRILLLAGAVILAGGVGYWRVQVAKEQTRLEAKAELEAQKKAEEEQKKQEEAGKKAEEQKQKAEEEQTQKADYGKNIVIVGADMTAEERTTVMNLMEMDDSELENAVVIPITMEQESAYMGETDDTELYGSASKSCVRITTTSPGSGLQISMHNIDYCTEEMYRQELQKIGITDANVVIAAARSSAGTAALAGISIVPQYVDVAQFIK